VSHQLVFVPGSVCVCFWFVLLLLDLGAVLLVLTLLLSFNKQHSWPILFRVRNPNRQLGVRDLHCGVMEFSAEVRISGAVCK
jgi:hypothetical protein